MFFFRKKTLQGYSIGQRSDGHSDGNRLFRFIQITEDILKVKVTQTGDRFLPGWPWRRSGWRRSFVPHIRRGRVAPGCAHLGQSERRGMDGFNGNRYMMQFKFLLQFFISGQAINKNITNKYYMLLFIHVPSHCSFTKYINTEKMFGTWMWKIPDIRQYWIILDHIISWVTQYPMWAAHHSHKLAGYDGGRAKCGLTTTP